MGSAILIGRSKYKIRISYKLILWGWEIKWIGLLENLAHQRCNIILIIIDWIESNGRIWCKLLKKCNILKKIKHN